MNRINFHRGTFLEKEELVRLMSFMEQRPEMSALISASTDFGFVSPGSKAGTNFLASLSQTPNAIDIIGGHIIDSSDRSFKVEDVVGLTIPDDSNFYWLKVGYSNKNYENGLAQVDSSGNVSGTVSFNGVVRSQSSGVPTCIRFSKDDGSAPLNDKVYQVVDIVNDNNIILSSGYSFTPEFQLRVIVLGSIPMGRRFTEEQMEGLYSFDSFTYTLSIELVPNTPPAKEDWEYYVCRVRNSGGTIVLEDKRTNFWKL